MKQRTLLLTVASSIVLLSVLTGLKVVPGPEIAGLIFSFLSLFILPGILISLLVSEEVLVTVEGFTRLFFYGVLFCMVLVSAGFIPGVGYTAISFMGVVLVAGMAALYTARSLRDEEPLKKDLVGRFRGDVQLSGREKKAMLLLFGVLFILCSVFFFGSGDTGDDTDALDHISYVRRSVETGKIFPGDSFFREGDGTGFDARKGLWHPVMSLWTYQSDTVPEYFWRMAPAFLVFFYLLVFWFFARELLGSTTLVMIASILMLLTYRGGGIAWLAKAPYSKNIAQLFFWGGAGYLLRYFKGRERWNIYFASILIVAGTSVHLVFPMLILVFMGSLLIFTSIPGWGDEWQGRYWTSVPFVIASIALPIVARLLATETDFNIIHTHRQAMLLVGERFAMVDPVEALNANGMLFLFVVLLSPFLLFLSSERKRGILAGVLFLFPVILVLNPVTGVLLERPFGYLHYRILFAAPAIPLLALSIYGAFRTLFTGNPGRITGERSVAGNLSRWIVAAGLILVLASLPMKIAVKKAVGDMSRVIESRGSKGTDGGALLVDILSSIPENSVIVSDPLTSYMISAYTDHFVTVILGQHGSPSDVDGMLRLERTRDFFSPAVPLEEGLRWMNSEDARFIVLDLYGSGSKDFFNTVPYENIHLVEDKFDSPALDMIEEIGRYRLYGLSGDPPDRSDARALVAGQDACDDRDVAYPLQKSEVFVDLVQLDGGSIDYEVLEPGDTLSGYFCWKLDRDLAWNFPLGWTIRIDTPFPKGVFFRQWYDKQYRRITERKRGVFYRWTVSGNLMSAGMFPDQWESSRDARQEFKMPIPENMAPGRYEIRLNVSEMTYLANRRLSDYLRNDDTDKGILIGKITVREPER